MVLPTEEEIKLYDIIKNGTKAEQVKARAALNELIKKEEEEEKKNPPPWGDLML